MSILKRVLIISILNLLFSANDGGEELCISGLKSRAKYSVEKVVEEKMKDTKDILIDIQKKMKNTKDILIDIQKKMKDTNDIFILIDNLLFSLKDGREELCIPDPKHGAEKAAEDNMKNIKVKILLIFHYAAEKAGGNSAEKAAIYRKTFADLYRTQYFAIIEAYKKAAEKSKIV